MTFQQTSFDFDDPTENFFTNLYDTTGKTIGISSTGANTYLNSGAISGAIGSTGPSAWSYGATGATGPSGYYSIYGGNGGYSNVNYPTITLSDNTWGNSKHALDVKGDANFEGDVKIKGKSISEALDKIEQRLALLTPNSELEEKWDELKELGDRYRELEKQILEKQKIWDILKK